MTTPTNSISDLKNRLATQAVQQQAAQTTQAVPTEPTTQAAQVASQVFSAAPAMQRNVEQETKQEAQEEALSTLRIFWGEFPTHQNYLTKLGKTVAFYKGYCMTDDPEIIECIKTIREVKEVTGQVKETEVPLPVKRERNRNWAAAQGHSPTVMNPAELLMRAANIANSSHITQTARSDSAV